MKLILLNIDILFSIIIDGDFIYLAGYDNSRGNNDWQWRVEKRNKNTGDLDTSFDGDGILVINPSVNPDILSAIIIDGDYIYLAGSLNSFESSGRQWRVEKRNKNTGAIDMDFSGDGVYEWGQSSSEHFGNLLPMLVMIDNYLYVPADDTNRSGIYVIDKTTGALRTGALFENPAPDVK